MNSLVALPLWEGLALFVTEYMPSCLWSKRTCEEYERDVEQLVDGLVVRGRETWQQVGLADLQAHTDRLSREGLEPSSLRRKIFAVKAFFKFLVAGGYVTHNPADALIPPERDEGAPRFLTEFEYNAFLAEINSPRDKAVAMLFLQTGMRLSELVALTLDDVHLPKRVSRSGRTVEDVGFVEVERDYGLEQLPLNWKACEALNIYLKEREKKATTTQEDAVFLNRYGKRLSQRAVYNMVKKYLLLAGIEEGSVRTLRATAAAMYAAKGGSADDIQTLLGHKTPKATRRYVQLGRRRLREMVQEAAL